MASRDNLLTRFFCQISVLFLTILLKWMNEVSTYVDQEERVKYTFFIPKFRDLSEFQKLEVMHNLRMVVDSQSGRPLIHSLFNSGCVFIQSGNPPKEGHNVGETKPNIRRPGFPSATAAKTEEWSNDKKDILKIDLGVFPTADFRFSRDLSTLPEHYKVDPGQPPRVYCPPPAPINLVFGNVSIWNVTTTGVFNTQPPPQPYPYYHDRLALKAPTGFF